ncbi:hypothetical protein E2N92_00665 [Methanofollis formosanus]|uniref:Uncharacterized protein n=1 Tax=Methanofollis formosanus TaxID=299308 RepID=A0A8G1EEF4_9EURY|nr:hypothetical protein [Methanofollis formosanus]QYZ78045.1 hypothetical protein E2N92_00665 [Methanofollis formosanus]
MYRRRICRHALDQIILGKKVPCFEKVTGTFASAMDRGLLPRDLDRDLEEEWNIYCTIIKMLRRWPACTPTESVEHLAQAEGKTPLEDHPAWSARVSVIIEAFVEHDNTIFPSQSVSNHIHRRHLTALPGAEEKKTWRDLGESDEIDETFPRLEEVYSRVLPQEEDPGELNQRWGVVIVRGVYWAAQKHYRETDTIPSFCMLAARLGISVGMRHFPMALYTWVAIRDLHREINRQMNAVDDRKADASSAAHRRPENEG